MRFVATAVFVLLAVALMPDASRACPVDNCRSQATFTTTRSYDGEIAYMTTWDLQNNGGASDFASSEIWLLDNVRNDPSGIWWVEQGWLTGQGGSRRWFAAENCGTSGVFIPSSLSAPLATQFAVKTSYNGSGMYAFYRDGSWWHNSSTCHQSTALNFQVGGEMTQTYNQTSAEGVSLQKRTAGTASWSYVWPNSTPRVDAPMAGGWYTTDLERWWYRP